MAPPDDGPAPDHDDEPPTDEDRELLAYHEALDLDPDGEATRLAAALDDWTPDA